MKKTMLAAALLAGGLALAGMPSSHAAPAAAPVQAEQRAAAVLCVVNDNGVNFRGGPGPEYPVLGQVHRGQQFNAHGQEGNWVHGDVVGGRTGVWIHVAYLDC
ncbi:SH3 domain-containing protein [Streptomyces sp. NPDC052676]|uniref:SH3 domain-containing protein n=1 Tax=Streptomyces sp. NPDC052676 TaxID=3154953 RepID=UPI003445749E